MEKNEKNIKNINIKAVRVGDIQWQGVNGVLRIKIS